MKKAEFLEMLYNELEIESVDEISESTNLGSLDEWDSMAAMIVVSIADEKFGVTLSGPEMQSLKTVGDMMDKLGREKFTG